MEKIGWIGTGILGTEIVKTLLRKGINVSIYNRTKEKADNLVQYGAKIEDNLLDLFSKSTIIFSCLGSQDAFRSLIELNINVLNKRKKKKILIDISTISPQDAISNAVSLKLINVNYIESPVSGGKEGANQGIMTAICSGNIKFFVLIKNLLSYFCSNIHYVGEHGNAQKLKIINNLAESINLLCASEVILLGLKLGFDVGILKDILTTARGRSTYMDLLLERLYNQTDDIAVTLDVRTKDLALAKALLEQVELKANLSNIAIELFEKTKKIYGLSEDQSKCFDAIQSLV
jgi:3-hydroxyisobutyrate dehydrogenase-like beta-hydroxyacid dehydrogenase